MSKTVRLLSTYKGIPPQTIITVDNATGAALLAGGVGATTDLTGGVPYVYPAKPSTTVSASLQVDGANNVTVKGAGATPIGGLVPLAARNTFALMMGSDHSDYVKYGVAKDNITLKSGYNGYLKMLQNIGVKPYLAITTCGPVQHAPEEVGGIYGGGLPWANLREMQDAGVEMVSHSHFHVQSWDKLNMGIFIGYNGAGSAATISITPTTITLAVTGVPSDGAVLTRSSYPTLISLINAINTINPGAWDAHIEPHTALLGTEPLSCLLPISGARGVRGTPSGDNRLFCCGGGIHLVVKDQPTTTPTKAMIPEHVKIRIRTNGYLEVSIDGVVQSYTNLAAVATDTMAELVVALNAAHNAQGLLFSLADNGGAGFTNYMRGDELCVSMVHSLTSRTVGPINLAIEPAIIEAGLTQAYMRERQWDASIDTAEANGIQLKGFAEPGNGFRGSQRGGYARFKFFRGTIRTMLDQQPVTYPLSALKAPLFTRSDCIVSGGYTTAAHMTALADAMADSPGHACCLLWHRPSTNGGSFGYDLGNDVTLQDQTAANVMAFGSALAPHIAAGRITPTSMGDAADAIGLGREPFNRFFNANFKTAGLPIPTTDAISMFNERANVPGWIMSFTGASGAALPAGAAVTIGADGMLNVNSPNAIAEFTIRQSVILDRNVEWEYGFDVREANLTAGSGALFNVLRTMGRPLNGNNLEANTAVSAAVTSAGGEIGLSTATTGAGQVVGRLSLARSTTGFDAARMVGAVSGPFTITTGVNDGLSIQINGINPGAGLTLAAGTLTATQVVDAILAWMKADSVYSTYPEFWDIAKARRAGRAAPALILGDMQNIYRIVVTGTALLTLFGGVSTGAGHIAEGYSGPNVDSGMFALAFVLQVSFQGSMKLGKPWLKPLEIS